MYRAKRIEKNGATMRTNTQPDCCACDRTLQKARLPEVIIPGSGYGRNSATFVRAGFEVTGIEISDTALNLACQGSPEVRYQHGSVLEMPFDDSMYDGIFCFNVLHLFRKHDRAVLLQRCREQLKEGGKMFFVVFSERKRYYRISLFLPCHSIFPYVRNETLFIHEQHSLF